MKAEYGDLKKSFGEIKLFPENIDDLWHLQHLISYGDLSYATTFRSLDSATDKARPEKTEKKPVRLGIRVEKVEFHHNANRLRVSGVIEYGPDTGFYHTLNVEAGHEISVVKNWRQTDLERIERAVKASTTGLIHIITVEEGEAEIFRIRQYGPELVTGIISGTGKREGLNNRQAFFADILDNMLHITGPVVIAGPGFVKDDFMAFANSKNPEVAARCITAETRRIGRGAVQEVIGLGVLDKITEDIQLRREVEAMEELIKRLSSDGNAAYGFSEVSSAVDFGAVEHILVCDRLLRDRKTEEILEKAENMRASVIVLSTEFDPGRQLDALGGIAALLRFAIA
ncbi:mRNA surveillance protein pelota [Methanoplanus sp. FWC-SCC4]|uniref:Protein pelota homolog n=1 Tax=Methanochimaera problematica TaxID=2609417 RepID=A0AA97FA07_9EURY|nr:mRNA surveillance protein pelota [Methanoplanus sp. FWC-SCC4]WOF15605.1 mRNA surveillance protein pelota [Methanoplanus sp. FWC-SCC4]